MSSSSVAPNTQEETDVGINTGTGGTPLPPPSTTTTTTTPLSFLAFSSTVESPFWVKYCKFKLETIRLSEEPIEITATYSVGSPRLQIIESSLSDVVGLPSTQDTSSPTTTTTNTTSIPNDRIVARGHLIGFNTFEAFSKCDKNTLLSQSTLTTTTSTKSPMDFILITFADLKQHTILYWFGLFPVILGPDKPYPWSILSTTPDISGANQLPQLLHQWRIQRQLQRNGQDEITTNRRAGLPPYFVVTSNQILPLWNDTSLDLKDNETDRDDLEVRNLLQSLSSSSESSSKVFFVVMDTVSPSSSSSTTTTGSTTTTKPVFGWPLRRLIAKLVLDYQMGGKTVTICSWRSILRRIEVEQDRSNSSTTTSPTPTTTFGNTSMELSDQEVNDIQKQLVWIQIHQLPTPDQYSTSASTTSTSTPASPSTSLLPKVVGWEWNAAKKKPSPRRINLQPLLDPKHLAIQAADLNLKLMKWRMLPALNVNLLQQQKVLLLGAGTLGCSVARTLLGWGIRNMTLLDYGNVSYSNPVRQNLFTLEDCHGTGKPKAQAAVDALELIAADVDAKAIRMSIPMPGHGESKETITEAVNLLDQLVHDADVIYLLTDTRESRWLPTLMAAAHDKILLNAALGLDSWLVMRHGGGGEGKRLGCYFCNDVVAPENSTKNRTLDQQCTVTRPGLAPIAASMAVELMVALLHHPLKQHAPAPTTVTGNAAYNPSANTEDESSSAGALGIMPHQIRGSLVSYQTMTPTVPAFDCCTGCSPKLIRAYRTNKVDLVYEVCQSPDGSYLEDLTGLTKFRAEAADKLAALDDDDDLWDDE